MNNIRENLENYLKKPYSRILIPDDESGTFTAEVLEFPGCIAQGDTAQEAYERLEEAIKAWIEAALELGQEIPPPSLAHGYGGKVALRLPKSLHRHAAMAAERDGTSLNQFIVTAIAEKVGAHKLYEKLTGRMEQYFIQGFLSRAYVTFGLTIQAATGFGLAISSHAVAYGTVPIQAASSMPVSFWVPNIDFSKKEVAANA
jgi:predicted RNase H-like HicB family nuclease/drug/metabolite transporter superfamily protein YnfA